MKDEFVQQVKGVLEHLSQQNMELKKKFLPLLEKEIDLLQEEIDYRKTVVRADLHEKIMAAKELGDFSENSELHETKRAKGRNESRITYLENMIKTAKIVEHSTRSDIVGLGSTVTVRLDGGREMTYQIVTTISQDAQNGKVSVKSPFAKAIFVKSATVLHLWKAKSVFLLF